MFGAMKMAQEWDIKPLSKVCTACQRPFEDGERYTTRLVEREGRYERGDYCVVCWERERVEGLGCSRWTGIFHRPPPAPDRKVRKETAETLLRRLMGEKDPARAEAVYILAVMLERQRVLVEQRVENRSDGMALAVYLHRRSSETFLIPVVSIAEDRLPIVQEEILRLLTSPEPAAAGEGAAATEGT